MAYGILVKDEAGNTIFDTTIGTLFLGSNEYSTYSVNAGQTIYPSVYNTATTNSVVCGAAYSSIAAGVENTYYSSSSMRLTNNNTYSVTSLAQTWHRGD